MMRILFAAAAVFLAPISGGATAQEFATATFTGGCFWCMESNFDAIPGVVETVSGYTGGITPNPTYKQVSAGGTGHREAVQITYDPAQVAYADLLTAFWHSVDPTDPGRSAQKRSPGRSSMAAKAMSSWSTAECCRTLRIGVPQRWRIINVSNGRFMRLSIPGIHYFGSAATAACWRT